jgi:hypothetical protein
VLGTGDRPGLTWPLPDVEATGCTKPMEGDFCVPLMPALGGSGDGARFLAI